MPYETYKKDGNKYCVRKSDSKKHVGCSDKYHIGGYLAKLKSVSENELKLGKDKVYYHGGDSEITNFSYDVEKKNRTNNVAGFYFTDRKDKALAHGNVLTQANLNIKNPFILGVSEPNIEMAMQFKKELVLDNPHIDKYDDWFDEKIQSMFQYGRLPFTGMDGMAEQRVYKAGGFDSVKDGDEIAVFDSKNINIISSSMVNENELIGGKADNLTPKDIAKKFKVSVKYIKDQIKNGKKIESEHTDDENKQYEISIDHVSENPDYYERIDKMEKEANKYWNDKLKKENMNETKILIKKHLRENFNKSSLDSQIQKELQRLGLSPETEYYIVGKPIDGNIEEGVIDSLKKATVACAIAASGMLIGCQKDKPVVMYKYIYSDAGSKSYNEKNKTTIKNSALIPYDRVLSSREIQQEQDKIANDYLNNLYKSIEVDTKTDTLVPQDTKSAF
jgi:hypothetical protein